MTLSSNTNSRVIESLKGQMKVSPEQQRYSIMSMVKIWLLKDHETSHIPIETSNNEITVQLTFIE